MSDATGVLKAIAPLLAAMLALATSLQTCRADATPEPNVQYFPTPQKVVDKMLEVARVTSGDYVIDLGSGDGRIPMTAAKRYGAKALGVDIDPKLIAESQESAQKAGVADKVTFRQEDLFKTDISDASVLTLFLLGSMNNKLKPRILAEMNPGARVVTYNFNIEGWEPQHVETVDGRRIFLFTVPARSGPISGKDTSRAK